MSGTGLGVFARCYPAGSPARIAEQAFEDGFSCVQLNLSALGRPTIPTGRELDDLDLGLISEEFRHAGAPVWGLSASYNMAHPDQDRARRRSADAARLIGRAAGLGIAAVTLCTGSRDPENMWRGHPDNSSQSAWSDFRRNLDTLLSAAADAGVVLGIEPEPGNVVSGTGAAERLIEELGDDADRIGFILDPANLVSGSAPAEREQHLRRTFSSLGPATVCVHAKDVVPWAERLSGADGIDFALVTELHSRLPSPVPMIVQDATPEQMAGVRRILRGGSS